MLRAILNWAKKGLRRADANHQLSSAGLLTKPLFLRLNEGWNAEPNGPMPTATLAGPDLLLRFGLNPFIFEQFAPGDEGILRFRRCVRYRLGLTNMDGWFYGQCRYSKIAPEWGEFYEISRDDHLRDEPSDWVTVDRTANSTRHFLFYFRDETFECIAADWAFEPVPENALYRRRQSD